MTWWSLYPLSTDRNWQHILRPYFWIRRYQFEQTNFVDDSNRAAGDPSCFQGCKKIKGCPADDLQNQLCPEPTGWPYAILLIIASEGNRGPWKGRNLTWSPSLSSRTASLSRSAFIPGPYRTPGCKDTMKRKKEFHVHCKNHLHPLALYGRNMYSKTQPGRKIWSGQDPFPMATPSWVEALVWSKTCLKQLKAAIPIVSSGDSVILLNNFVPSPNSPPLCILKMWLQTPV